MFECLVQFDAGRGYDGLTKSIRQDGYRLAECSGGIVGMTMDVFLKIYSTFCSLPFEAGRTFSK